LAEEVGVSKRTEGAAGKNIGNEKRQQAPAQVLVSSSRSPPAASHEQFSSGLSRATIVPTSIFEKIKKQEPDKTPLSQM
jgi:hypothetical protein